MKFLTTPLFIEQLQWLLLWRQLYVSVIEREMWKEKGVSEGLVLFSCYSSFYYNCFLYNDTKITAPIILIKGSCMFHYNWKGNVKLIQALMRVITKTIVFLITYSSVGWTGNTEDSDKKTKTTRQKQIIFTLLWKEFTAFSTWFE